MIPRLNKLPAFAPSGPEKILQPGHAGSAEVVDKTAADLVTFDNLILALSLRKLVYCHLILPPRHWENLLSDRCNPPVILKHCSMFPSLIA